MKTKGEWLRSLKKGDLVAICFQSPPEKPEYTGFDHVERVTKTQVILECGAKASRQTGVLILDSNYVAYQFIDRPTAQTRHEALANKVAAQLVYRDGSHRLCDLADVTLKRILKELT